jgi:hypothetical protein
MAIDFPNSPNVNDEFTVGDRTWRWDGTVWSFVPSITEINVDVASELLPIVVTPNPPRVDIVGTAPVLGFNDDGREFVASGDRHVLVFDNDSLGDRGFDTQLSTVADSFDMGPATFDAVASAESWGLVGGQLTGRYPFHFNKDEEFGRSVAMAGDGTRVVVGGIYMYYDDGSQFVYSGGFRVYEQVGTDWSQMGSDIYGTVDDDWFGGGAIAISRDGTRVAAAATSASPDYVRVFEYDTNTSDWVQMGSDIDWSDLAITEISEIALSSDGSRLIVSSANSSNTTYVRAYDWNGTAWVKLSADITGVAGGGWIRVVQVSDNGNRVILGAPSYDGVGSDFGRAQVFDWTGSAWSQVGPDINGSAASDDLGYAVDISADGSRIVVSAPQGFTGSNGYIQVYDWSGSAWVQVGADIVGTVANEEFGYETRISGDGSRIVQSTLRASPQYVSVFEYNGSAWVQLGSNIIGDTIGDYKDDFGFKVDISTDGSRIIGTDLFAYNGGHALVYEYKLYNNLWTDSHYGPSYPYHDLVIGQQIQFTVASGSTGYDTTTTYYVAATPGPNTFQLSTSPDSTTIVTGTGDSTGDWYYNVGEPSGFAIKTGIPDVDGSVYRMYIGGGKWHNRWGKPPGISLGEATNNPFTTVHIRGGSSGRTFADKAHTLVVENHNNGGIGVYTPRNAQGYMQFGDNDNAYIGGFRYRHGSDYMYMRTGGVDHLTLTNVGNLEGNGISWSPTFSNLTTIGTSTVTAFYHQVGGYVHWTMKLVFGSGFSWSSGTMVLGNFPVSAADSYEISGTLRGYADDVSVQRYWKVFARPDTTTSVSLRHVYTTLTYLDSASSQSWIDINDPFSWVSGDILFVSGTYRAA